MKIQQENRKAAKSVKKDLTSVMKMLKSKITGDTTKKKRAPDIKYKNSNKNLKSGNKNAG